MILHYLQHVPFEGLGSIEKWARDSGHRITRTRLYSADPLPALSDVDLLVVMGGPMNVYEEGPYPWLVAEKGFIGEIVEAGKPVLGICLGAQLLAAVLGSPVYRNDHCEIGWFDIKRDPGAEHSKLAGLLPETAEVFHWHGDTFDIPAGAVSLAHSQGCRHQGFIAAERLVGLQFHLEATRPGAAALIEHCPGDLKLPGPFVQNPQAILADENRFSKANQLLVPLLNHLTALTWPPSRTAARQGEPEQPAAGSKPSFP
jgi:GMP synthase-like glutamine amidotransferase